jgi:hypothetical protein
MPAKRKHLTADEIVMQMIELAEKKYNCSQILKIAPHASRFRRLVPAGNRGKI